MKQKSVLLSGKTAGFFLAAFGLLGQATSLAQNDRKIDASTIKELETAEKRLGEAIEKHDEAALSEILANYYADSFGDDEIALPKRRVLALAKESKLYFYRIEKDARFSVSAQTYTVEGQAVPPPPQFFSEQPVVANWMHVQRRWTKVNGHWILIMQNVRELKDEKSEANEKK
jgi:hypothetical protein